MINKAKRYSEFLTAVITYFLIDCTKTALTWIDGISDAEFHELHWNSKRVIVLVLSLLSGLGLTVRQLQNGSFHKANNTP